jgi:hypothetical protein
MESDKDIDRLVKLLKKLQELNEQDLAIIETIIRQAMASGIQDLDYLDKIMDPLYSIVLSSGIGRELYDEYLTYVESFNPQRAKEDRDHDDELNGVYDDLIDKAAELAQEYHKGQVDKQGVDYSGVLTAISAPCKNQNRQNSFYESPNKQIKNYIIGGAFSVFCFAVNFICRVVCRNCCDSMN